MVLASCLDTDDVRATDLPAFIGLTKLVRHRVEQKRERAFETVGHGIMPKLDPLAILASNNFSATPRRL